MQSILRGNCKKKASRSDIFFSVLVILFYYVVMINNVVKRFLNYEGSIILLMLLFLSIIYICFNTKKVTRRFVNTLIFSLLIYLLLFFIGYIFARKSFSTIIRYFEQGFVYLFFGSALFSINNYRVLMRYLKINSYGFLLVLSTIMIGHTSGYIMSHSYLMLVPTLIHITMLVVDKKIGALPFVIIDCLVILIVGSRGPFIVIGIYTVLLIFFYSKRVSTKVILLLLCLLGIYFVFINGELTYNILTRLGIQGRTVDMLLMDHLYDSGRSVIYETGRNMIDERPLFGWGLAGDTLYMENGGYVHNIILEFQIDFGRFFGILLFIALNLLYLIALYKSRFHWFVLFFVCLGYIPLFVSNSYLLSFDFYFSFFLCLCLFLRTRKKKVHKKVPSANIETAVLAN